MPNMHFVHWVLTAPRPGPRLIVLGAVHGNERAGTLALKRLAAEFECGERVLKRGRLTLVPITNPKAYAQNTRNGDRNLNRRLRPTALPLEFEDHVANWLCALLAEHDGLLDLHSFMAPGEPFALVGSETELDGVTPFRHAEREVALAQRLGVRRCVDGWLSTYERGVARRRARPLPGAPAATLDAEYAIGTTEYMRALGGWAITLECGQHEDPRAPEVGYQALLNLLAELEMIEAPKPVPQPLEGVRLVDVIDRHDPQDVFVREWKSFDPLRAGEPIARRASGELLTAPADGWIVFPAKAAQPGSEWYYLAERTERFAVCPGRGRVD
ncbi:MAG: succinylglutamate desuccinylase/aspartoacylase family protein [Casimicrobiaceae bacterium]|nr:succinylglutamate desuccinylase/aspartoacylase family protein [Casimicrobiaceae bacterium]